MTAAATLREAYAGRRVMITGHTGFKGGWLSLWLHHLGADVTGFSLPPATIPSLFQVAGVENVVRSVEGDIRDRAGLDNAWRAAEPEIVFHLAAQSLVRESYREPLTTLATNVTGTAHVLDIARERAAPVALVLVTSDKCYENREWVHAYREDDAMGGHDVYSMSKGAAELLISSYRRSFFTSGDGADTVSVASARAGNVVGGGDWAPDRIVPDCIRALEAGDAIGVRNPAAVRPFQHVLEPLSGYLTLGARLLSSDPSVRRVASDAWNFGPTQDNTRSVRELVETVIRFWGAGNWRHAVDATAAHEAGVLRLATDKAHALLQWKTRWGFDETMDRTVKWYRARTERAAGEGAIDMAGLCVRQINDYMRVHT
ncbi:MAG: CDP-glucose 4,6-dehydratase [Gemmatimonadaceae bacterium]|nr:CDP-glucose 4,6-dehydratase [Gemmatimonadaceae bacterium]